jgi:hypothetical protein
MSTQTLLDSRLRQIEARKQHGDTFGILTRADFVLDPTTDDMLYSDDSESEQTDNVQGSEEEESHETDSDLDLSTELDDKRPLIFDDAQGIFSDCTKEFAKIVEELGKPPGTALEFLSFWMSDDSVNGAESALLSPCPIDIWKILAGTPFLRSCGILGTIQRLLSIPASEATCERALWHLRRVLLPSAMKSSEQLVLTRLRAIMDGPRR